MTGSVITALTHQDKYILLQLTGNGTYGLLCLIGHKKHTQFYYNKKILKDNLGLYEIFWLLYFSCSFKSIYFNQG